MIDIFVAALSFEDRAPAAFDKWVQKRKGRRLGLLLLDYESSATPGPEAAKLREKRFVQFSAIASASSCRLLRAPCSAYSSRALVRLLEQHLLRTEVQSIAVDITCLTRPHLMGTASFFAEEASRLLNWSIEYTIPRTYGLADERGPSSRLRDVLSLPLNTAVRLRNQGLSLGILVLGHDGTRVGLALDEIEPSAGLVLVCGSSHRPDYEDLASLRNRLAVEHLLGLRLSGSRGEKLAAILGSNGWQRQRLELDTPELVADAAKVAVRVWTAAASIKPQAQIALFPFGPKLVGFSVAYALCLLGGDNVVVVIPTYRTHDLRYSEGISRTLSYPRDAFADSFNNAIAKVDQSP